MTQQAGLGVDASGGPVIDPSENVKALNEAGHKRQDDLWIVRDLYIGSEIRRLEEIVRRVEETSSLRSLHSAEITQLHQGHDTAIHRMEQERGAALRSVDEMVRVTEANRNLQAVTALAAQTTNIKDALASSMADSFAELNKRVSAVELQQSEGRGSSKVADPMMAEMLSEFKTLRLSIVGQQNQGSGQSAGVDKTFKYIMMALVACGALITIGSVVVAIAFAIRK